VYTQVKELFDKMMPPDLFVLNIWYKRGQFGCIAWFG